MDGLAIFLAFSAAYCSAHALGMAWLEAKHASGFALFAAWVVGFFTSVTFTWLYALLFAAIACATGHLSKGFVRFILSCEWTVVVLGIACLLGAIALNAWAKSFRSKQGASMSDEAYSAYLNCRDSYSRIRNVGGAFRSMRPFSQSDIGMPIFFSSTGASGSGGEGGGGGSGDSNDVFGMILLVGVALAAGAFTTIFIVKIVAAKDHEAQVNVVTSGSIYGRDGRLLTGVPQSAVTPPPIPRGSGSDGDPAV